MEKLCQELGVSRSGFYAYLKRKEVDRDREVKIRIESLFYRFNRIYGYRQIQMHLLQEHGILTNHKKVLRLMQEMGLRSRIRRPRRSKSASTTGSRVAENLLNRNFQADEPNKKWVTDVTQYRVMDTWLYLSAIKDLCNGEIVAFHMSRSNNNALVLNTFSQVLNNKEDMPGLIVHSDQGFQYTSYDYHDMLLKVGAQISMSRRGNCHDNASMESFFALLKTEALYPYDIRSLDEAQRRIEEYIHFYNHNRPQKKLNKLTPVQYRCQLVA